MERKVSAVSPQLFEYVNEYAEMIERGEISEAEDFDKSWDIFYFCQLFFDQFFGQYGKNIRGFSRRSRETALALNEKLVRTDAIDATGRHVVVLYEEFCDLNEKTSATYGGSDVLTVVEFHEDYLIRLLYGALDWAQAFGADKVVESLTVAIDNYRRCLEAAEWPF